MTSLPYVTSPGNITKALGAIKSAAVPPMLSQDFVKNILKIPGGSGNEITVFLKKLGFAAQDSSPTELYRKFRNSSTSGESVAKALRIAYAPLYVRNEYMHTLSDEGLTGLLVEETGLAHDARVLKMTLATIKALKSFSKFEIESDESAPTPARPDPHDSAHRTQDQEPKPSRRTGVGLNLGYTININLPATSDQAVFNAIFKSIKENLLREDDA